jgi:prenyltransferase beta subunit
VAAAGRNPSSFGGRNLVAALEHDIAGNGSVSDQTNLTSFAVLALRAAGVTPRTRTLSWLVRQQDRDGGFNFSTAGAVSDVDDTAAALEALAGGFTRTRHRAVKYIEHHQSGDGGFPQSPGAGSNAQSTAWAIQGLLAAGVSGAPVQRALSYLTSLLAPDGHVRYSRSGDQTPVWVTAEAAMALAEKPLPLAPVPVAPRVRKHRSRGHHGRGAGPGGRVRASESGRRRRVGRRAVVRAIASRPSHLSMALARDAGILDALALAPLGIG